MPSEINKISQTSYVIEIYYLAFKFSEFDFFETSVFPTILFWLLYPSEPCKKP